MNLNGSVFGNAKLAFVDWIKNPPAFLASTFLGVYFPDIALQAANEQPCTLPPTTIHSNDGKVALIVSVAFTTSLNVTITSPAASKPSPDSKSRKNKNKKILTVVISVVAVLLFLLVLLAAYKFSASKRK